MWSLSSQTRDRTHFPYIGRRIHNHWTTSGVPYIALKSLTSLHVFSLHFPKLTDHTVSRTAKLNVSRQLEPQWARPYFARWVSTSWQWGPACGCHPDILHKPQTVTQNATLLWCLENPPGTWVLHPVHTSCSHRRHACVLSRVQLFTAP